MFYFAFCWFKVVKRNSEFKDNITFYKSAIASNPNDQSLYFNLALSYQDIEDDENAAIQYQKAVKIDPADYKSLNNLGTIYLKKNELQKAEESYLNSITVNPGQYNVYYNLANVYISQKNSNKAINLLEKILKLKPDFLQAKLKLEELLKSEH